MPPGGKVELTVRAVGESENEKNNVFNGEFLRGDVSVPRPRSSVASMRLAALLALILALVLALALGVTSRPRAVGWGCEAPWRR
jgi:hypothetical protein